MTEMFASENKSILIKCNQFVSERKKKTLKVSSCLGVCFATQAAFSLNWGAFAQATIGQKWLRTKLGTIQLKWGLGYSDEHIESLGFELNFSVDLYYTHFKAFRLAKNLTIKMLQIRVV